MVLKSYLKSIGSCVAPLVISLCITNFDLLYFNETNINEPTTKNYSQFIGVVKETYTDLESFKNVSKSMLLKNKTQQ